MNRLESLVQISQYYGSNPAYVIAGGGNTSYKNSEKLYIKASGIALSTIDTDGFVVMSRQHLGEMEDKAYSDDPVSRYHLSSSSGSSAARPLATKPVSRIIRKKARRVME